MSGNIEDRRGAGGGFRIPIGGRGLPRGRRAGGIGGIGLVLAVLLLGWVLGIDPLTLLEGGPGMAPQSAPQGQVGAPTAADDEMTRFVATVLADTEDTWQAIFERAGQSYREPTLVLFDNSVRSACGFASAASGPFYCPGDQKMYIDLGFYRELERRFGAPGDFAQAYVLAHEVGHHVQNLIGVLPRFNEMRRGMSEAQANEMSVRVELQADCFAGLWAHHTRQRGLLERGDLDEALNAAAQIGDDAIQRRTQGYVVPESFNHGASEQRARWFLTGYENGSMQACDTFNADRL